MMSDESDRMAKENKQAINFLFMGDAKDSDSVIENNLVENKIKYIKFNVSNNLQLKKAIDQTPALYKGSLIGGFDVISDIEALKKALQAVELDDRKSLLDRQSSRLGISDEAPARLGSFHLESIDEVNGKTVQFQKNEVGPSFNTAKFNFYSNVYRIRSQLYLPTGISVRGLLKVSGKKLLFLPDTDDEMVVAMGIIKYTLDIDLVNIVDCRLMNDYKDIPISMNEHVLQFEIQKQKKKNNNKSLFATKKRKDTYAHELQCVIKAYNFIVDKKNSQAIYSKLTQHSLKSKEALIQNEFNLDVGKAPEVYQSEIEDLLVLLNKSDIITGDSHKKLYKFLPPTIRLQNLKLLFSTSKDGTSMNTFYSKTEDYDYTLLIVKDTQGFIFGSFATERWHPDSFFYGTGESFLWSLFPEFHIYNWTNLNTYYQRSDGASLSMGSGKQHTPKTKVGSGGGYGMYGLSISHSFSLGTSDRSDTYFNRVLASSEEFKIDVLEVWGFTRSH